jgi:hypothetical protein
MKLDPEDLIVVSQILERDSKVTTYKFALLRATIDVIQLYDHLITPMAEGKRVLIPTGLIVERWIWYYYPLLENDFFPQIHGESVTGEGPVIAFRRTFTELIRAWQEYGRFTQFYNDYRKMTLPEGINHLLGSLVKELYQTITRMPMKHIGQYGSGELYSIYRIEDGRKRTPEGAVISTDFLIRNMGTFSIPYKFYLTLKYLGTFIEGTESVLNKWADFITVANRRYTVSKEVVLDRLYRTPEMYRDVGEVKRFYLSRLDSGGLFCVWSGKRLGRDTMDVDHVLPFARFPNNSFWNLLPAARSINNNKRDRIPEPELLDKREGMIFEYWDMLREHYEEVFLQEVQLDLLPATRQSNFPDWEHAALDGLKEKADFLIRVRGIEGWRM